MNKFCGKCGKENTSKSNFCPYCGEPMTEKEETKVERVTSSTSSGKLNVPALVGFIIAMGAITISFWGISVLPGIAAIILSSIGLSQINKNGERGKGFAIAGLVVGIVSVVFGSIMGLAWFADIIESFTSYPYYY